MKNTDNLADNLDDLIKVKTINVAATNMYLRIIEVILSQDSKICLVITQANDENFEL
jgi:hypothetical protein